MHKNHCGLHEIGSKAFLIDSIKRHVGPYCDHTFQYFICKGCAVNEQVLSWKRILDMRQDSVGICYDCYRRLNPSVTLSPPVIKRKLRSSSKGYGLDGEPTVFTIDLTDEEEDGTPSPYSQTDPGSPRTIIPETPRRPTLQERKNAARDLFFKDFVHDVIH